MEINRRRFLGGCAAGVVLASLPVAKRIFFLERYRGVRIWFSGTRHELKAQVFHPGGEEYALGFVANNRDEYERRLDTLQFVMRRKIDELLA